MDSSVEYIFIGNNLAVDLVNTQIMVRGQSVDLLQTTDNVVEWAEGAGLTIKMTPNTDILPQVIELRENLKSIFEAKLTKRRIPPEALPIINRYLTCYPPPLQIRSVAGKLQLGPANEGLSTDEFLGKIAYEAAKLLVSNMINRLKKCLNEKCVLMFLDTSRANRRCWCSMKTCGNRAKVASHYSRVAKK